MATDIILSNNGIDLIGTVVSLKETNTSTPKAKITINRTRKTVDLQLGDSGVNDGNIILGGTRISGKLGITTNKSVKASEILSNRAEISDLKVCKGFGENLSNGTISVYGSQPDQVAIKLDGRRERVGIGTSSPSFSLHVNGTVAGVGNFKSLSDKRCKEDIQPLTNCLNKILNLQGVSFKWKTDFRTKAHLTNREQIGFIAQDVEKSIPEVVTKDQKGIKSVAYSDIIPVMVEALKSQQQIIDSQKIKVKNLSERIEYLEQKLSELANSLLQIDHA